MVIITNFQAPKELEDLADRYYNCDGFTNLEILLEDSIIEGYTEWTVDKNNKIGDIILFMCAKTAKDHIGHVCAQARKYGNQELIDFAEKEREKYKKYSGYILGAGILVDKPFISESDFEYQGWRSPWYGKIKYVQLFDNPISIDEFRAFITISRTGSITKLTNEQWDLLKEIIINKGNELDL